MRKIKYLLFLVPLLFSFSGKVNALTFTKNDIDYDISPSDLLSLFESYNNFNLEDTPYVFCHNSTASYYDVYCASFTQNSYDNKTYNSGSTYGTQIAYSLPSNEKLKYYLLKIDSNGNFSVNASSNTSGIFMNYGKGNIYVNFDVLDFDSSHLSSKSDKFTYFSFSSSVEEETDTELENKLNTMTSFTQNLVSHSSRIIDLFVSNKKSLIVISLITVFFVFLFLFKILRR